MFKEPTILLKKAWDLGISAASGKFEVSSVCLLCGRFFPTCVKDRVLRCKALENGKFWDAASAVGVKELQECDR